jgi:hypothetical protein
MFPKNFGGRAVHEFSQLMVVSPRLRRIYGMTSGQERAYFFWFAKQIFCGYGEIVDLGCGLGSTTIPLVMGLVDNSKPAAMHRNIHAYDAFTWTPGYERYVAGTALHGKFQPGESFLEEFNSRVAPWKNRIRAHAEDLSQCTWNGEIELLLVDAMKSWALTNNIIRKFFPALIPGTSFVIHQDFSHWFTSWIHLVQYRLRHYFEPVYDVPDACSLVLQLVRRIPDEVLKAEYSFSSFTPQEIDAAFDYSIHLVARDKQPEIAAAKVMVFLHERDVDKAETELENYRSQGLSFSSALGTVENRLRRMRPDRG